MTAIEPNGTTIDERSSLNLHNQTEEWIKRTRTVKRGKTETNAHKQTGNGENVHAQSNRSISESRQAERYETSGAEQKHTER